MSRDQITVRLSISTMSHARCSGLEILPSEIITNLAIWLSMYDIQARRLVNRSLALHSFQAFRRYIRRRNIYLDARVLGDVQKQLITDGLACYVEEARFSDGSVWSSDIELYDSLKAFFLLAKAYGRLQSVDIATTTANQHRIILLALMASLNPLQALNLHPYGHDGPAGLIDYDDFLDQEASRLTPLLKQLQAFSWSFDWYPAAVAGKRENNSNRVDSIRALYGFVALIPQVAKLTLSWFSRAPCEKLLRESERFFGCTYEAILSLPRLHEFHLYGGGVSANHLLKFLTTTVAKKISLYAVRLRTGTWQSILAILSSGRFDSIRIGDLHEAVNHEYKPVFFNTMGKPNFGSTESKSDGTTDEGEDVLMPLQYSTSYWLQS